MCLNVKLLNTNSKIYFIFYKYNILINLEWMNFSLLTRPSSFFSSFILIKGSYLANHLCHRGHQYAPNRFKALRYLKPHVKLDKLMPYLKLIRYSNTFWDSSLGFSSKDFFNQFRINPYFLTAHFFLRSS